MGLNEQVTGLKQTKRGTSRYAWLELGNISLQNVFSGVDVYMISRSDWANSQKKFHHRLLNSDIVSGLKKKRNLDFWQLGVNFTHLACSYILP